MITYSRKQYRLKAHTGPTIVQSIADKLRSAGFVDVLAGTETVYWSAWGTDSYDAIERSIAAMKRIHSNTFGLQFTVIREEH